MPIPNDDSRLRLKATAYVIYYHKDLAQAREFLLDFGLSIARETPGKEVHFAGYGEEPFVYIARQSDGDSYFGGAAYEVESQAELERASALQYATEITSLDAPGGGEFVRLTDPVGHHVYLVHGQSKNKPQPPKLEKLVINYEDEKPRKGKFHRFQPGPALIHRWGHYGVTYPDGTYQQMYDWYTQNLALAPSDVVLDDGKPVTCFFHIDRGLEFTDHHAFFFKRAKGDANPTVAHSAFEVHDFDIEQLGHNFLMSKGYENCWGVGRHVLGSQVFDYWFDPSKFIVEHYADGDLVNSQTVVSHVQAGPQTLKVWGPPVPEVF
ncbi:Glyoxalase/Bleomycin resistance protein/Dihydroxybiphenyl dioxygenase [Phaeosphaeriaceae sp. SRC1lsM3a]|nr:Glyoxalase/Bleomycin resistance protein/Dihydroxybiphenyl dioxygenase [Stagonospora sp. SRC1lsM3a]